ncbi:MAG: RNA methyltransferase [Bacteroidales bacterium]|nr:RNA methyltransferase [Bacteroidales bacterium]
MNPELIQPLSVARRKLIASLQQPRHRRERRLFVAEGAKCISELTDTFACRMVVATHAWYECDAMTLPRGAELLKATRADMERISSMSNPPEVIAVMEMPPEAADTVPDGLIVALDGVQDPGNLGTIIRACDWFGVNTIICSRDTVDLYNSKVIQATMGALARVSVRYVDLPRWLAALPASRPVYGTFLDGDNIYSAPLAADGVIVMGNEGKGISSEVAAAVTARLFIPPYPVDARHVESLNVSVATAIILSQFRKNQ